jgi:polyferredoxin
MNYLSPYVSIDGAMMGVVSGSVLVFLLLFLSGLFFGRAWCGWVCPAGGLSEICMTINSRPVPVKKLRVVRYSIFMLWFGILIAGFVLAGGVRGVDPLHLSERVISVDEPAKYIVYYMVLLIFFVLSILIGRRAPASRSAGCPRF